jgi:hypothetical protein
MVIIICGGLLSYRALSQQIESRFYNLEADVNQVEVCLNQIESVLNQNRSSLSRLPQPARNNRGNTS